MKFASALNYLMFVVAAALYLKRNAHYPQILKIIKNINLQIFNHKITILLMIFKD
jgi:hypothetical protein